MLTNFRIATVREKSLENEKFSRSGKSQGISVSVREIWRKREKSGNFRISKKIHCLQASEKYNFYKLQVVYGQKCYFHKSHGLRCSFIN